MKLCVCVNVMGSITYKQRNSLTLQICVVLNAKPSVCIIWAVYKNTHTCLMPFIELISVELNSCMFRFVFFVISSI
ncbi:hypothetical protein XELAEV_18025474mg [Xenopus laevis]|uniref:Uncharacterized protein n=1 Tax=Xenopus laevis TaxID=8355 RepID=A0A974HLX1_XENLA|nr:hypothetical protein XELAEV_18025474mg [Xenopus laevis]